MSVVDLNVRELKVDVPRCPRCEGSHETTNGALPVHKLAGAPEGRYFFFCPENGQPVHVYCAANGE